MDAGVVSPAGDWVSTDKEVGKADVILSIDSGCQLDVALPSGWEEPSHVEPTREASLGVLLSPHMTARTGPVLSQRSCSKPSLSGPAEVTLLPTYIC